MLKNFFLAAAVFCPVLALSAQNLPLTEKIKISFSEDVQPILANKCYSCHGSETQENDLRWDSKSAALKGGVSGPPIIPGKSAESKMIRMVSGLETPVMPRKGERLSADQIGILRAWIDQGAEWPEEATAKEKSKSDWWSFQPAVRPTVPESKNRWARNEVDRFILAKLNEKKLSPSPEADRVSMIRRVTFDLHGLPPNPAEVKTFLEDKSSNAYEKLVDRLLASPRYGERWARHWLDTIHFGETHGYDKDKPRLHAWPYRDYVIRAFNSDKPYSRFVEEQLAGDVLFPDDPDGIAAMGFIAAGPWDFVGHVELPIEKTDGLIARYNDRDDMVMTTMSTFQSLTVHCARCHNHKFDPISQKDYYALQAVFAGVDRADRDFDPDPAAHRQRRALSNEKLLLERSLAKAKQERDELKSPELVQIEKELTLAQQQEKEFGDAEKSPSNGYHSGIEKTAKQTKWVQVDLGAVHRIQEIRLIPARPVDFPETPGFGFPPRFTVEASEHTDFREPEIIAELIAGDFANPEKEPFVIHVNNFPARSVRVTAHKLWKRTDDFVFALSELQVWSGETNVAFQKEVTALDSIEAGLWSKKFLVDGFSSREKLSNTQQPAPANKQQLEDKRKALEAERDKLLQQLTPEELKKRLEENEANLQRVEAALKELPTPQKLYAATRDFQPNGHFLPAKQPRPVHLLARGDVKRPGEEMISAGLRNVPGPSPDFQLSNAHDESSRRAALARWITDPRNMLTRRSLVNRIWHYHFGKGIVETPNDFGHMGGKPSHPELLDWLSFWFLDNGESFKKLHRLIVTSATYRQSSAHLEKAAAIDGDNRLLWRMNRTRLDAESIRDSMLQISGHLDLTMGGPSVQQFAFKDDHSPVYDYAGFDLSSGASNRRSIYRFIVRSVPDPMMDALDCPDASILTPVRNTTMTALQALAVLNDPFVIRQSELLAERLRKSEEDPNKQIDLAFSLALNRLPTTSERNDLVTFAGKHGLPNTCRLIFNMSEFMFID